MEIKFNLLPDLILNKQAIEEIIECNDYSDFFGLMLTHADALVLLETRNEALTENGRIEFGGGIIDKMIKAFSSSPYLYQKNYVNTLNDLIKIFYYFKNESLDLLSDDELIALMKKYFDSSCQGSLELLQNRELEAIARNIRFGKVDYENIEED